MNQQTTLALVRHGETDWNAERRLQGSSDIALNDVGRGQVLATAELLQGQPWDFVVCSPLSRARESASIIARTLGIEVSTVVPELVERDYGPAEGMQDGDELRALRIPGGFQGAETEADVTARATAALGRIATEYPGARVIVVAHGTLIRLALSELSGSAITTITNAGHCLLHHEPSADSAAADAWSISVVNGAPFEPVAVG
ncbi:MULTISPECIES: histidine phosphatase family protein [Subtercola]|uniref:Histidine phosphatase family protein n=1 Tax=Subtercola vilae TaxID=2056433 RepID=A0A4T2CDB6_9MICO|nr:MULTISPECIES: histidine phosphatase family protein [Subtercola]MEA9986820.1 histidine phosphatase family protein [Subtercola sp. RTI3]TIH40368.1 histidine phosphatase family protein [Subtercola vilae]